MKRLLLMLLLGSGVSTGCHRETPPPSPPPVAAPKPSVSAADGGSRIVFRDAEGRVLTESELQHADGRVSWEIADASSIPEEARFLHQRGRDEGARHQYAKAAVSFYEASQHAPTWPAPVYDAAYLYLLGGNAEKALELYTQTVALAPRGYFTALTAVDALTRERAGTVPAGTYRDFLSVEWEQEAPKRIARLQQMVGKAPNFAPAWQKLADELQDPEAKLDAIAKGLQASPDAETKGYLLVNRAVLWKVQGRQEEAVKELGKLALDPASPLDVAETAKSALAFVLK